tara:strand:- start:329 stop:436 length:108 start_codon:yes stop_codon:yes gene_type:complete
MNSSKEFSLLKNFLNDYLEKRKGDLLKEKIIRGKN